MLTRRAWPEIGGVERHIFELAEILRRKGHTTSVISSKDLKHPKIKFLGLLFIWFWMLKNIDIFAKADIVHVHDVAIWYLPVRFILLKKPFYVTFHGWEGKFPIPGRYKFIRKISEKMAWGNICVGEYIEKWYEIKADYIIYGAVYKNIKYPRPPQAKRGGQISNIKNINQNLKTILFLGRLQEDTGLLNCLRAFQVIKEKHPEMKILFLGDGPLKKEAEKYGQVLGFQKDTAPYLTGSRFVFTSGYLSMLEAMAAGKLVFAMHNNPLKYDTLGMSPFSRYAVVANNPHKLAQRVDYFLKNSKKERGVVAKAYNWAHLQTWDKIADTYLGLWKKT